MNLSYWELKSWFTNIDYTIVGSGIVGLHTALRLREKHPESKILVIEKGILPQGASTKNAGFACFGSVSEILDDLENNDEEAVLNLIKKRWNGLQLLRNRLGDSAIDFQQNGGYELFQKKDEVLLNTCFNAIPEINKMLKSVFPSEVFNLYPNVFDFKNINETLIFNPYEGQIDTGMMMESLLKLVYSKDIKIINQTEVKSFSEVSTGVQVDLGDLSFMTKKLFFATNGFAGNLTNNAVQPGRAQVLITKPIKNLRIKGVFHLDRGYYYFRNINERILFGGGRNLDFEGENTTEFGTTSLIQNQLEKILKEVILPDQNFEIEHRWSGIMGLGNNRIPIVKQLSEHVFCGVRLGGMGVAIGSLVGQELADLYVS